MLNTGKIASGKKHSTPESTPTERNTVSKEKIIIPLDNDYVKAVMKSFKVYLIEKATCSMYANLRLQNKLEAAALLHQDALRELAPGVHFGVYDESNTELIFKYCN